MQIFCELRSSYPSPAGTRKNTKQWAKCPLVLYAKPSNKRFIIPLQKKNCYLQLVGHYFVGKSIKKSPDSVCEDDVNIEQNVRAHYMSNHWMRKKKLIYIYIYIYFGFYFLVRVSKTSYSSVIVAPFESAGIRPVVNRLNQDTTLYYGLVFCAFSWTCMVKDIIVEW